MDEEKSLQELMWEAFQLSLKVCYSELATDGSFLTPREDLTEDEENLPGFSVWAWADGLAHGYYERMSYCQCSLQAMIDFDIGEFEETVKKDIASMKVLAEKYKPIRLTTEEMVSRGYRGKCTLPKQE